MGAENSRFRLYFRPDTLAIIVESKESGELLYSTVQQPDDFKDQAAWKGFYQSGIVMEFIEDVKSTPVQADLLNLPNEVNVKLAELKLKSLGMSIDTLTPEQRAYLNLE